MKVEIMYLKNVYNCNRDYEILTAEITHDIPANGQRDKSANPKNFQRQERSRGAMGSSVVSNAMTRGRLFTAVNYTGDGGHRQLTTNLAS